MKIRGKAIDDVIQFHVLEQGDVESDAKRDARDDQQTNVNTAEAAWIEAKLVSLLEHEQSPSVAVITPFTDQQKYIAHRIAEHPRADEFEQRLDLAVFTFDSCQGEERDCIIYSMVATTEHDRLNYIFPTSLADMSADTADGKLKYQRLNVGLSRGKEQLLFVCSKPIDQFNGSARQVLSYYYNQLQSGQPSSVAQVAVADSPVEQRLIAWLQQTSFYQDHRNSIELLPQFAIDSYLRSLDPNYEHPSYKADLLMRFRQGARMYQFIVEYDGFEQLFDAAGAGMAVNGARYLTAADVERECILESYGYKMLRLNRFTVGTDPVTVLDQRLRQVVQEFVEQDGMANAMVELQAQNLANDRGLSDGTHKRCLECGEVKPLSEFYDESLKTKYGIKCLPCKRN